MHNYENTAGRANSAGQSLKVGLIGARGYSGQELARLLMRHPHFELAVCFAGDSVFELSALLPELSARKIPVRPMQDLPLWLLAPESNLNGVGGLSAVCLATPAEVSLELAPKILEAGVDVIDLSGAFRLTAGNETDRKAAYQQWYKAEHTATALLDDATYGLVPFASSATSSESRGRLIANPGCYATSVLMALVPLLKSGVIDPATLVIDSKSGTSGGGRKAAENLLFTEVDGECLPYRVGLHQHLPEIRMHAESLSGISIDPHFVTHLIPVRRGIISGVYARPSTRLQGSSAQEILDSIQAAYSASYGAGNDSNVRDYPLVRFGAIDAGFDPESVHSMTSAMALSLKRVAGSARTQIQFQVIDNKVYIFSLIDNLLKGAASQAVENLNRINAFPVGLGLTDLEGTL